MRSTASETLPVWRADGQLKGSYVEKEKLGLFLERCPHAPPHLHPSIQSSQPALKTEALPCHALEHLAWDLQEEALGMASGPQT